MTTWGKIHGFFEKLKRRTRGWLSHHPILYGLVGGVGIVLFWRGVWLLADTFMSSAFAPGGFGHVLSNPMLLLDGAITTLVSIILLLITGLFVTSFIGNEIIITGIRGEKLISEKSEDEVVTEGKTMEAVQKEEREERRTVRELKDDLREIHHDLEALKRKAKKS